MDTLKLYLVTYNVATRSPDQDLNSLLDFPSQFNRNHPLPDFYIIGLQEVKSQPQNLLIDSLFTDPWTSAFNKILCRQGFITVKAIRLQGILLLVYTQLKHVTHLRDIQAQYTKTGLGGMWGNKGAVSIRFNIYGCSVCLVNCHLTAHEHLLADRINDYNTIVQQHNYHVCECVNILYHDYVFWLGDLNFRMVHPDGNSPSADDILIALQKVEKDKYTALLRHDQLLAVMDSGEAFSEFTEPEVKFPPTYKYFIGTDDYDVKRVPSWTDRILYKVIPNNYENITLRADLVSYTHLPQYIVSDHKPVAAHFKIKIRFHMPRTESAKPPKLSRAAIKTRSAAVMSLAAAVEVFDGPNDDLDATNISSCDVANVDNVDSFVDEPAFSNYTEKTVEFAPIVRIWYIGDADFRTQCTLSPDVEVNSNDWIGIYDANFHSLDDYIAYEYLAKVCLPSTPSVPGEPRTITLSFPVGSGVRAPGFYRFIYFSQANNDVRSVLGISEPFEVSGKSDKLISVDPCEEPSCSSSPHRTSATTTTTDIFTDFTGLDVASLSRHFSNELNID